MKMKDIPFLITRILLLFAVLMAGGGISHCQGKKSRPEVFVLTGTITDYSPTDSCGDFGKLHFEQALSGQTAIKAFEISDKGTFQVSIPLDSPRELFLNVGISYYPVWGTPGGKQHVTLSGSTSCSYQGDGSEISDALSFCQHNRDCFQKLEINVPQGNDSLATLKEQFTKHIKRNMAVVDSLQTVLHWSDETATMIGHNEKLAAGCRALDFLSPTPKGQQPPHYFRPILEELPLNQKEAEALRYYHQLLHDVSLSDVFMQMHNDIKDTIITIRYTFLTYLLEQKAPLTEEERKVAESHLSLLGRHFSSPALIDSINTMMHSDVYKPFDTKYKEYTEGFREKVNKDVANGMNPMKILITTDDINLPSLNRHWDAHQAMFRQIYPHPDSYVENLFLYHFFTRQWRDIQSDQTAPIDTTLFMQHRLASVTLPEVQEAMTITVQRSPAELDAQLHAESLEILHRLVKPYAGKYVLLDFWGTTCAPCLYDMKKFADLRKSYLNSPDFAYIFLTTQGYSYYSDYQKHVSNQLKDDISLWLSSRDFAYLSELFSILGVPRYIMINREGDILDRDFSIYMLQDFLTKEKVRKENEGSDKE